MLKILLEKNIKLQLEPSWLKWIEHWISAPAVTGSNPVEGTNIILGGFMRVLFLLFFGSFIISEGIIDTVWIDNSISEVEWIGNKISGSHNGKVKIKNGYVLKKDDLLTGGEVIIDMESISVDDIKHEEWNLSLVEHLKNEDFFDVKKFPTATLKILSSQKSSIKDKLNSNIEILGELTIKNITNKIPMNLYIDFEKNISKGELIIDRTKWDIKYGSSSFFDNLGDRAIYNDFILKFDLSSKK